MSGSNHWDVGSLQMEKRMSGSEKHNLEAVEATWERLRKLTERLDRQFHLHDKFERCRQYAVDHPMATMFSLLTLAFCSVPLLCFIGFALTTFVFTFIGFLVVEGVLLTFGTLLLGGVLCIVGFLSLGIGTFLALAWLSARTGHRLIGKFRIRQQQYSRSPTSQEPHSQHNGECIKDSGREKDM